LPFRQLRKRVNIEGKGKKSYLYLTERKWREVGVSCVMRSYFRLSPRIIRGKINENLIVGETQHTWNNDCDISVSGNVKGRKRGNTDVRGEVICKWTLNMCLIWAARLNVTVHISGPLAGSREKDNKQYKAEEMLTNRSTLSLQRGFCCVGLFGLVERRIFIFSEFNQQDANFPNLFISERRSTCFRRFFRPSSGVQNCT